MLLMQKIYYWCTIQKKTETKRPNFSLLKIPKYKKIKCTHNKSNTPTCSASRATPFPFVTVVTNRSFSTNVASKLLNIRRRFSFAFNLTSMTLSKHRSSRSTKNQMHVFLTTKLLGPFLSPCSYWLKLHLVWIMNFVTTSASVAI